MTEREKWLRKVKVPFEPVNMTEYEKGVLLGLLIGEGYFGGDRRPAVRIGMNVRHRPLLVWVGGKIPGSRIYGPYKP